MITPASIGDWAMFIGLLGTLGSLAAFGNRLIFTELPIERTPTESVATERPDRLAA